MRARSVGWVFALLIASFSVGASACNFYFSYDAISASIGTVGEIGIRVEKTHNKCTLTSMDEYLIEGEGVQILGETEWEEVGADVYEKWIQVSLSETGDGLIRISKDCTKEGYQEEILPITGLTPNSEDAVWTLAWSGTYPFEVSGTVTSVVGQPAVDDSQLSVAGLTVNIPEGIELPEDLPASVRLFTETTDAGFSAVLLVGDGLFLRFDHLL